MLRPLSFLLAITVATSIGAAPRDRSRPSPTPSQSADARFQAAVDRWLDAFARRHPSIAAGNGLHQYDGTMEDMSAAGIAREIAALKRERAELAAIADGALSPDARADRMILLGVIDGWLLEQETLANWRRNPMLYAVPIADGVHNLMVQAYAPADVRMRRIISKLAGVPGLLAAARTNLVNPPRLLADRGVTMLRGASGLLANDVLLAFADRKGTPLYDSLRTAAAAAQQQIDGFADWATRDLLPRATGDLAIGGDAVARRYRAEELIEVPLDTLVALGERHLVRYRAQFDSAAKRFAPTLSSEDAWARVRRDHPRQGAVVADARVIVDSLTAFVRRKDLVTVPTNEKVIVEPAQPFDLGFASMHASPPLERTPLASIYYITDARADQPLAEQDAWLERFNHASLTNTTAHEAMPGHWVHATQMRKTPGKIRRIWIGLNPFPQPSSGQDGWAHYAEQLVVEQGYANGDPRYAMAQLSDALVRVCRLLSGIKVHRREWTLEQARACFADRAFLAPPAARREAERAAYDPTYGGYFLGKLGLLTLRADMQAREGAAFSLKRFHERVLQNGIAPVAVHRQLLLPGDTRATIR
ncbi:MAG: DUF885 domain-containing protein [Gemmatimonadaceae bacterium]|nr:DUF885 domain-containing protein [Gemmatimonadaceae bacterium]